MKKLRIFPLVLIICLLLGVSAPAFAVNAAVFAGSAEDVGTDALAAVVADVETGRLLYADAADVARPPASLTKIMTALCAIEAIGRGEVSLKDKVTATEDCFADMDDDGSSAGIVAGETMSLNDLLYCMLLSSANEACNIVAKHVSGSIADFVALMNERAAQLGCKQTCFKNPHGLPADGHLSSAQNMAMILREAMSYELFMKIAGTAHYTTEATNVHDARALENSNALLNPSSVYGSGYTYEGILCGKTGHTSAAGFCLASAAEHDGVKLICVVLGCQAGENSVGSFVSSRKLYDWAFSNYAYRTLLERGSRVGSQPLEFGSGADSVELKTDAALTALVPENVGLDGFEQQIRLFNGVTRAPVYGGEALGELTLLDSEGNVYGKVKLVAADDVSLAFFEFALAKVGDFFGFTWVKIVLAVIILIAVLYIVAAVRYRRRRKRQLERRRQREAERRARQALEVAEEIGHVPPSRPAPAPAPEYESEQERARKTQLKRDYYAEFFAEEHRRENSDE